MSGRLLQIEYGVRSTRARSKYSGGMDRRPVQEYISSNDDIRFNAGSIKAWMTRGG